MHLCEVKLNAYHCLKPMLLLFVLSMKCQHLPSVKARCRHPSFHDTVLSFRSKLALGGL